MEWATTRGLFQFQQPPALSEHGHPITWPRLVVSLDQESSGVCASGYLQRKMSLNLEQWWYFSHGGWRDIIGALKLVGNWAHMLIALISYNVPCGPWSDDIRFHQVRQAMEDQFASENPSQCPLFLSMQDAMINDGDHYDVLSCERPEHELWRRCQEYSPWLRKAGKCVVNRFLGMRRRAKEETAVWTMRSWACQYTALEMGFFKGSRFTKVVIQGQSAED